MTCTWIEWIWVDAFHCGFRFVTVSSFPFHLSVLRIHLMVEFNSIGRLSSMFCACKTVVVEMGPSLNIVAYSYRCQIGFCNMRGAITLNRTVCYWKCGTVAQCMHDLKKPVTIENIYRYISISGERWSRLRSLIKSHIRAHAHTRLHLIKTKEMDDVYLMGVEIQQQRQTYLLISIYLLSFIVLWIRKGQFHMTIQNIHT